MSIATLKDVKMRVASFIMDTITPNKVDGAIVYRLLMVVVVFALVVFVCLLVYPSPEPGSAPEGTAPVSTEKTETFTKTFVAKLPDGLYVGPDFKLVRNSTMDLGSGKTQLTLFFETKETTDVLAKKYETFLKSLGSSWTLMIPNLVGKNGLFLGAKHKTNFSTISLFLVSDAKTSGRLVKIYLDNWPSK